MMSKSKSGFSGFELADDTASMAVSDVAVPFLRSALNYNRDVASLVSSLTCEDLSLAVQSERDECDINTIVKRFGLTGQLPSGVRMPTYEDFTGVFDFQSAANAIALAHESFDTMPAEVRARFNNNPAAFVDFCSDERNRLEAEKLGLVPVSVPASVSAPVVVDG
ncbi:MAG: internal scaffolding protein [Microviridae sp.]|nr:MAG: internal scaffolding protein [Microviridae sp.]